MSSAPHIKITDKAGARVAAIWISHGLAMEVEVYQRLPLAQLRDVVRVGESLKKALKAMSADTRRKKIEEWASDAVKP